MVAGETTVLNSRLPGLAERRAPEIGDALAEVAVRLDTGSFLPVASPRNFLEYRMTNRIVSNLSSERVARDRLRGSLHEWAELALAPQGHAPATHHRLLIHELEGVASGRWDRLMLLLPPGSAKSTYASLLFPPWFLANRPWAHVIAASHTASLARSFGRGVRALIEEHESRLGVWLDPSNRSAGRFGVVGGGTYFATGVRGPITGRRADLLLIDDPVKSQAEADSGAMRDHLWDWFRSDLVTRLKPGGRVVLVMTRWHPDDLGGRLLQSADAWRVVRLPALAESDDVLGRSPGEPLWPEWEDAAALRRKRAVLGDRTFEALFQQSPRSSGGRLFKVAELAIADVRVLGTSVRAWDLAASQDGGDWTVGVLLTRTEGGRYQVGMSSVCRVVLRSLCRVFATRRRLMGSTLPSDCHRIPAKLAGPKFCI